ncbi:MAG: hypothetical protein JRG91_09235 [Deltaproteobacteria bacterium]|nr:hypothetical protein [Deltaproteobacteria bacterium]
MHLLTSDRLAPSLLAALLAMSAHGCGDVKNGDEDADTDADDVGGDDSTSGDTPVDDAGRDDGGTGEGYAFSRTYGGNENDSSYSVAEVSGGGFVLAGWTESFDEAGGDAWIVRLDAGGGIVWQRSYGGAQFDEARSIRTTSDGGFVVAGTTESFGVGTDGAMWVLKLDGDGAVDWQKTIAGGGGSSIAIAGGGGYFVAGSTSVHGAGSSDAWVVKLDADGAVDWQNTYGGTQNDVAYAVEATDDDGCVVSGWTSVGTLFAQIWVMKLAADGSVTWSKSYGGTGDGGEDARAVRQTSDGGYIVVGWTMSFGAGDADVWVLKLDSAGDVQWQNTYGGASADRGFGVNQTSDGGYLVAGRTESFGAGGADMWLLKLQSDGTPDWQRAYGSSYDEQARDAFETSSGWYVVAGKDAYYGASGEDFWLIKMDTDGNVAAGCPDGMIDSPSASAASSSATAEDFAVTPAATSATVGDSSASPTDSAAEINEQCRSS